MYIPIWVVIFFIIISVSLWVYGFNYGKKIMLDIIEYQVQIHKRNALEAVAYERDVLKGIVPEIGIKS